MSTRPFLVNESVRWVARVVGTPKLQIHPGSMLLLRDVLFGGSQRLYGTVRNTGTPNTPVRRRVRLHDQLTGYVVREVWSHAETGAYEFAGVKAGTYYITSFDHTGQYNGEIATDLLAEPMPGAAP
jgi:hypothetical protein